MALINNFKTKGIELGNCYFRVFEITIKKENMMIALEYKKDLYSERFDSITYQCSYDINGTNPFNQAYEYLKTLEDFKEAKDC